MSRFNRLRSFNFDCYRGDSHFRRIWRVVRLLDRLDHARVLGIPHLPRCSTAARKGERCN